MDISLVIMHSNSTVDQTIENAKYQVVFFEPIHMTKNEN